MAEIQNSMLTGASHANNSNIVNFVCVVKNPFGLDSYGKEFWYVSCLSSMFQMDIL